MKIFQMMDIALARKCAGEGGQALHLHNMTSGGHSLFRRYNEIGHLFDQDYERLEATARRLGVKVIKVERRNGPGQHIDLCGAPLRRARKECENENQS
jgi:hypothetical protein